MIVWDIGGVLLTNITVIIAGVTILLLVLLLYVVNRTKVGRQCATSMDKSAARLMGINIDSVIT